MARVGTVFTGLIVVVAAGLLWVYLDRHAFFCPQIRQVRCIRNLERIAQAKEQYAQEHQLTNGSPVTAEQIVEVIEGGWTSLRCPGRGAYTIQPVGANPRCSEAGHELAGASTP